MTIIGLGHVQIAAPAGCEESDRRFHGETPGTRRFHVSDPFGDRVEIRAR